MKSTQSVTRGHEGFSIATPQLSTTRGALYQTDCLNLLRAIAPESIATIFADPPFNLQKEYNNGFEDKWEDSEYLKWSRAWLAECCRVLMPGGALFVYSLPKWAYRYAAWLDDTMEFRHWIALSMKGTYSRGSRLYPAHYALLYFTKGSPRAFNKLRVPIAQCRHCGEELKDYGGYRKLMNPAGATLSDFWEDTSPNRHRSSKSRPGVNELKPMIPARAIELSSNVGDIILDPFGGGGSTYQEAQRLGRFWLGSEIGDCTPIQERFRTFAPTTVRRVPPTKVLATMTNKMLT
jgi:site-specific DNA-methyltransferase (adenine-specific)